MGKLFWFIIIFVTLLTISAITIFLCRYNYRKAEQLMNKAEKKLYRKYHITDIKLEKIGDKEETILTIKKNAYTCIQIAKTENIVKFKNFAIAKKQLISADGYLLKSELNDIQKLLSFCA